MKRQKYLLDPHLDPYRLRERLVNMLDNNFELTPALIAEQGGIHHDTILCFIYGSKSPHRKTLVKIYKCLEALEHKQPIQVHIALNPHEEPRITIEEKNGSRE